MELSIGMFVELRHGSHVGVVAKIVGQSGKRWILLDFDNNLWIAEVEIENDSTPFSQSFERWTATLLHGRSIQIVGLDRPESVLGSIERRIKRLGWESVSVGFDTDKVVTVLGLTTHQRESLLCWLEDTLISGEVLC